jgi:hypothetical protein
MPVGHECANTHHSYVAHQSLAAYDMLIGQVKRQNRQVTGTPAKTHRAIERGYHKKQQGDPNNRLPFHGIA